MLYFEGMSPCSEVTLTSFKQPLVPIQGQPIKSRKGAMVRKSATIVMANQYSRTKSVNIESKIISLRPMELHNLSFLEMLGRN